VSIDSISKISQSRIYYDLSIKFLILIALATVVSSLISTLSNYSYNIISKDIGFILQKKFYTKLKDIPVEEFENNSFYNKLLMAYNAITYNGIDIVKYLLLIVQNVFSISGLFIILYSVHWSLSLGLFISSLPATILLFIGKSMRYKMNLSNSQTNREISYTSSMFMNKNVIKEIKLFNTGNYLIKKWSALYKAIIKKDLKMLLTEEKFKTFGILLLQLSNVLIAILLVTKILHKQITIGDYVSLIAAVGSVQSSLGIIGSYLGQIFEITLYNKALMEILSEDPNIAKENNEQDIIHNIDTIEIKNLSYKYPCTNQYVVKNINLSIKKNEKVAIVGDNGAGKSTLISILLGYYPSYSGQIYVNDIDFKTISLESYNKHVSAILQDFVRYKYSLKENIALGDISQIENEAILTDMVKAIGMEKKLQELNRGINTILSKEFNGGEELSGGEWQKIAISRAMIKNTDLIVLDEPTAALDPLAELEIYKLFNNVTKHKTTIMISHRLGITRLADKIIVMQNGEIVEQGKHDELIALNGVYKKMFLAQANWYAQTS
jgi:putative ABC transport system ATP-binding protein/ATP-binding cassette subfamily B protein